VTSGGEVDALYPLEQRYHFRAGLQRIKIICPSLHHLATLRQVLCEVVRRAHGVAIRVGELALDRLMVPALFVRTNSTVLMVMVLIADPSISASSIR
jgi:hypothetical protein